MCSRCYICRPCGSVMSSLVQAGRGIAERDLSDPKCLLCDSTLHVEAFQVQPCQPSMATTWACPPPPPFLASCATLIIPPLALQVEHPGLQNKNLFHPPFFGHFSCLLFLLVFARIWNLDLRAPLSPDAILIGIHISDKSISSHLIKPFQAANYTVPSPFAIRNCRCSVGLQEYFQILCDCFTSITAFLIGFRLEGDTTASLQMLWYLN
jgi:hypothetical protein